MYPLDKIEYGAFTTPICNSTDTTLSAFKLINALCMGCVENVKTLQGLLYDLFYSGIIMRLNYPLVCTSVLMYNIHVHVHVQCVIHDIVLNVIIWILSLHTLHCCVVLCIIVSSDYELPIMEWEHLPHIGPRPLRGFVGLKNAGATCYMNAVLQQLYMIPPVRKGILDVDEPARHLRQLEEEENRREKEREANRRNREEVRTVKSHHSYT